MNEKRGMPAIIAFTILLVFFAAVAFVFGILVGLGFEGYEWIRALL